jgi:hypothetical protein
MTFQGAAGGVWWFGRLRWSSAEGRSPLVACVVQAPLLVSAFPDVGFLCWFFVVGLFRVSSDSLLCACINLAIGLRLECVTDSLFK